MIFRWNFSLVCVVTKINCEPINHTRTIKISKNYFEKKMKMKKTNEQLEKNNEKTKRKKS